MIVQGGSTFLQALAHKFGRSLFTSLPVVHKLTLQPLLEGHSAGPTPTAQTPLDAKQASETMQILKVIGPVVNKALLPEVLQAVPAVVQCCGHTQEGVRDMAVECAVQLSAAHGHSILPALLRCVDPCSAYRCMCELSNSRTFCHQMHAWCRLELMQ